MKRSMAEGSGLVAAMALMLALTSLGTSSCRDAKDMLINVDSTALHVGIAGEVRRSPIMPVERPGVENSAPLAGATITIQRDGGKTIGNVVSDSTGRFYVELDPGTYILTAQPFANTPFPIPPGPQRVVVPPNGIVHVRLDYDTGIR
jgi:hypothetical protein